MNRCVIVVATVIWLAPLQSGFAQSSLSDFDFFRSRAPSRNDRNPLTVKNNALREKADAAYARGEFQTVVDLTTGVIASEPEQPFAYYQRASAYIDMGKQAQSVQFVRLGLADAREGLRLAGNRYPFLYTPYLYGLIVLSEIERRPENAELAIKIVTPVLDKPEISLDDRAQLFLNRARARYFLKDYAGAAEDFEVAARLDRDLVAAVFGQAEATAAQGKSAEARTLYDRGVERFANDAIVHNNRGTFLQKQGDYAGALADYNEALRLQPSFPLAFANRGYTHSLQREFKLAEQDYLASLRIQPNQPLVRRLLAINYAAQEAYPAALAEFRTAMEISPKDGELRAEIGFARYASGDYAGAAADLEQALKLSPQLYAAIPWRYLAWGRAGHLPGARSQLSKSAATLPAGWGAQVSSFLLGKLSEEELLSAAQQVSAGLPVPEKLCDAHFFIAESAALTGTPDVAAEHYRQSIATSQSQLATFRAAQAALSAKTAKTVAKP